MNKERVSVAGVVKLTIGVRRASCPGTKKCGEFPFFVGSTALRQISEKLTKEISPDSPAEVGWTSLIWP
eukprot:13252306-Ditylum_brightwellii.AAC.1